jgi:hypothetical protein
VKRLLLWQNRGNEFSFNPETYLELIQILVETELAHLYIKTVRAFSEEEMLLSSEAFKSNPSA